LILWFCLSVPEVRAPIERSSVITVEAMDLDGKPVKYENTEGMLARVLLHEMDHLNGKLFVDLITEDYLTKDEIAEIMAEIKRIEKKAKRGLKK